jgi:hypothetical protein
MAAATTSKLEKKSPAAIRKRVFRKGPERTALTKPFRYKNISLWVVAKYPKSFMKAKLL